MHRLDSLLRRCYCSGAADARRTIRVGTQLPTRGGAACVKLLNAKKVKPEGEHHQTQVSALTAFTAE